MELEGTGGGREKGLHIQAAHPGSRHLVGAGWVRKGEGANINHKGWPTGNATCPLRELRL